jgi:hypothetical protein
MAKYPWEQMKPGPVPQNNGWFQGLIPKLPSPPMPKLPTPPRVGSTAAGAYGGATANLGYNMAQTQGVGGANSMGQWSPPPQTVGAVPSPTSGVEAGGTGAVPPGAPQTVGTPPFNDIRRDGSTPPFDDIRRNASALPPPIVPTFRTVGELARYINGLLEDPSTATATTITNLRNALNGFSGELTPEQMALYQQRLDNISQTVGAGGGQKSAPPTTPATIGNINIAQANDPLTYSGSMGNTWQDLADFMKYYTNGQIDFSSMTPAQQARAYDYIKAISDAEGSPVPDIGSLITLFHNSDTDTAEAFLSTIYNAWGYSAGHVGQNPAQQARTQKNNALYQAKKQSNDLADTLTRFLQRAQGVPAGAIQGGQTVASNSQWY